MIRVATIGTSTITERFAEAVGTVPDIAVTTAFSRSPARAAEFASRLDVLPVSDFEQLLAAADVDALYVGTPNSAHYEQALGGLRAGKHVLVEKPAVPTVAEWDRLVEAAGESGTVLLEAMRTAYDPGLDAIRATLPILGPVRRVSLRYQKRSARYDQVLAGETVNIFDPAMAGGALMDLGVYCVHALISLFGEPNRVTGASVPIRSGADGAGAVLAWYPEFVADLSYSKITDSTLPSEVQGESATMLIDHIDNARALTIRFPDGRVEHRAVEGQPGDMTGEVRRFVQLITTGADAEVDQRRTRQTLAVIEALRSGH